MKKFEEKSLKQASALYSQLLSGGSIFIKSKYFTENSYVKGCNMYASDLGSPSDYSSAVPTIIQTDRSIGWVHAAAEPDYYSMVSLDSCEWVNEYDIEQSISIEDDKFVFGPERVVDSLEEADTPDVWVFYPDLLSVLERNNASIRRGNEPGSWVLA